MDAFPGRTQLEITQNTDAVAGGVFSTALPVTSCAFNTVSSAQVAPALLLPNPEVASGGGPVAPMGGKPQG